MIVTLVSQDGHRKSADGHGRNTRARVNHCATQDDLCDAAAMDTTTVVIVDLDIWSAAGARSIARRIGTRDDPPVCHVIHGLSVEEIRALRLWAKVPADIRSIYPRYHDLDACLADHPNIHVPSATFAILRALDGILPDEIAEIFVRCIVLGERHVTMKRVAAAAGIGVKAVRDKLAAAGLPPFRELMAVIRIAHAIYRMDVRHAEQPVVAACGRFGGTRELENYVRKHTKLTPHQYVDQRGFRGILLVIEGWFS